MRARAVFLDRDGVINKVILREDKPYSPRKFEEFIFNDGIKETIHKIKELGYKVFVVSNQPDIARGEMSPEVLDMISKKIKAELPLDDIYICPHDDLHNCLCRKPKPGMLLQAAQKWEIDLPLSFMIGDTWKDIEAGRAAGCKTILLDAPYNKDTSCDFRAKTLREAIEYIMKFQDNNA